MRRRVTLSIVVVLVIAGSLGTLAHGQDAERQAIRRVIDSFSRAIDRADLPRLLAHIADDAVIDSKIAKGKVGKQKYADAMASAFERRALVGFETRDIRIAMVDATRATARATIYPLTPTQRYIYDHEWMLEKRGELWLIVGTAYPTKPLAPVQPFLIARHPA